MQRSRNSNQHLGKNLRRFANRVTRWHQREWSAPPCREIPCGTTCPASNGGRPRYHADCRDKLAARKPSTDTGPSKRKSFADNRRDNESRIFETHRRAGGPGVGRKPFGQSSFLILTPRPSPSSGPFRLSDFKSKKTTITSKSFPPSALGGLPQSSSGQYWRQDITLKAPSMHSLR